MTKEELEKEAEEFTDSKKSFWRQGRTCIDSVKQAYIAGAEPREKRIAELEKAYNEAEELLDKQIEATYKLFEENKELKEKIAELKKIEEEYYDFIQKKNEEDWKGDNVVGCLKLKIEQLKAQIEKLIDFVLSKTECCDVCPITDTCINSEGTCPYAGILAKNEEAVTRKWLMRKIAKEIKEK